MGGRNSGKKLCMNCHKFFEPSEVFIVYGIGKCCKECINERKIYRGEK